MEKILISACLYGHAVRYDGQDNLINHPQLETWKAQGRLVVLCPEVSGGLPTPRPPAECQPNGQVISIVGDDCTAAFQAGAQQAVELCRQHHIKLALLKENSPSCGSHFIYDGQFSGTKIPGQGLTAAALKDNDIQVFSEHQIDELTAALSTLEALNPRN
ncbi:DUF523 domain-containing protein [Photobacterium sp. SDRW27]|uniref:DUF523 domain-containing protein n=1 Tax=Photobacterium obscurum TaxID=2829490 RepID=UPI002244DFA3|nr:DUF523 domain-containing protein [Photobacterium obscurum]MCW8331468.1 DUF523 domain-containing protein [Photobacterium obscurum]